MERDVLIRQLRMFGNVLDLSDRTEIQLTNMIAGYRKKGQKVLYSDVCPYFTGVDGFDRKWTIGCTQRKGCDQSEFEQKNWACTNARQCFQEQGKNFKGFEHCRFFDEAQRECKTVKQKYICKCGKVFEKQGESGTTGYRLGLNDYKPGHECYGCHFVVPVEEGYPDQKVVDYECRASKNIDYLTTADIPRSRDSFHVARIHTLDMDFAREIWEYSRHLAGLDDSSKKMDLRGACYDADGRYCLSLYFTKTKPGVQSCIEISDKFFAGDSSRPGMTEEQEKQIVLQQIERSKQQAKEPKIVSASDTTAVGSAKNPRSIDQITLEINFYKEQTAQNIIEIGKRLIEAKQQLQHGEWLPWLRDKVQFSERSARNFMEIAKQFSNRQPVADLPYTKLLALLQVPEEDREEFIQEAHIVDGQEKTVSEMSKRELEQAIKERDQMQKQCAAAEQAAAHMREENKKNYDNYMNALVKLESSEKTVKTLRDNIQINYMPQLERVTELEKQIKELESRPVDVAVQEPSEDDKRRLREEGAAAISRKYEKQLEDARRQLEEAKFQTRQEMGLESDEITAAAASFRDTLDSIFDNFQLILRISPADSIETVVRECSEHMKGLIHEMEDSVAMVRNIALRDKEFELPPEDGME